jgi:hypothetical protein
MNNLQKRGHWIKRWLCSLLLIVLLLRIASAQTGMGSPAETALAGSTTARVESLWFATANPASLGDTSSPSILTFYAPSSIGIEGYYDGGLIAAMQCAEHARLAVAAQGLGVAGYREISARAVGAMRVAEGVTMGGTIELHSLAIDAYGSALAASVDVGAIARLTNEIRFGAAITNLARGRIAGADLPQRIAIGFAFDIVQGTTLSLDAAKELHRNASVALAISTIEAHGIVLRGGVANAPTRIAVGAGCRVGEIALEYGASYTQPVGVRHAIGLGFSW